MRRRSPGRSPAASSSLQKPTATGRIPTGCLVDWGLDVHRGCVRSQDKTRRAARQGRGRRDYHHHAAWEGRRETGPGERRRGRKSAQARPGRGNQALGGGKRSRRRPRHYDSRAHQGGAPLLVALVVDASVTLAWFLESERTGFSEALFDQVELVELWAPAIWLLEVPNALLVAERKKRIRREMRIEALERASALGIRIDTAPVDMKAISALAERRGLSTYDAAYLECAMRQRFDLATLDRALAAAAVAEAVPVHAPGRSTAAQGPAPHPCTTGSPGGAPDPRETAPQHTAYMSTPP